MNHQHLMSLLDLVSRQSGGYKPLIPENISRRISLRQLPYAAGLCCLFSVPVVANAANSSTPDLRKLSLEQLLQVKVKKVSLASGFTQSTSQAPAVTTVITAQEIADMGARDLGEALERVPGLFVSHNADNNENYTVRGIGSYSNSEVLVMLNGQPYKSVLSGDRGAWSSLPLYNVQQIEVIRGPGSALYGADAFAGTINLVTKEASDINGTEVGMRAGSDDGYDTWIQHGGQHQGVDVVASLDYSHNGSPDTIAGEFNDNPIETQVGSQRITAALDVSKGHWQGRMHYYGMRDHQLGADFSVNSDDSGYSEADRFSSELIYHNADWLKNWDFSSRLYYVNWRQRQRDIFDLNESISLENDLETYENQLYWANSAIYTGFDKHTLNLGFGYQYLDLYKIKNTGNLIQLLQNAAGVPGNLVLSYPETTRKNLYAYAQDTWKIAPRWELTAGLRFDDYSDFGSTVNPRLALVWQTTDKLTSKLIYGRAFLAPTFEAMYGSGSIFANNNSLHPQKLESYEIAFDYQARENWLLSLNLFSYEVTDRFRINTGGGPQGEGLRLNSGTQRGEGIEFETNWNLSATHRLLLNYAWLDSDAVGDDLLVSYPEHQAYLSYQWQFAPHWQFSPQVQWVKYPNENAGQGGGEEEDNDYVKIDLNLHYQIKNQPWRVSAGVRNLLDEDANAGDLPLRSRHYFIEGQYKF